MTKISFLVSAYKAERFMDDRLRNLLCVQEENDTEVIVIDSASPENERAIVEKWQKIFPERVRYIKQPTRTPYGVSWVEGWQNASSPLVCNANTDDENAANFTQKILQLFPFPENIAFAYTGIHVINEQRQTKGAGYRQPFNRELMSRQCDAGPCVTWRNDSEFTNNIDFEYLKRRANILTSGFDYFLWLYFMSLGYDGLAIPDILTTYMQRPDSIENTNKWLNNWDTFVSIAEFFPTNFNSYFRKHQEFVERWPLVPNREMWTNVMSQGKKWKNEYGWQEI